MNRPIVDARGIHKHFGALHVLKGVDLVVAERELVFVIGPSGSGKSTLLRCLNRLEEPTSGSVRVDGVDLLDPRTDINHARQRIGMVFQSFNLYPHMTALGNVTLALRKVAGKSRVEAEQLGRAALERVGLADRADHTPGQLSGGQQQRVAIASAIAIELAVLIVITGIAAGLILALLRSLGIRPLNWLIIGIVDLFRSLPPLVVIVLIYFGLPSVDLTPSGFVSTWLSLAFVLMAFSEEIFWAGITSVAKGQWEAARSTGLSFGQTLMNVVLPQALRLTIPRLTNRTIAITKGTALGTVVAVTEIRGQASSAMSNSYNPSPLMLGAAAYIVLFFPVVVAARWVETRFAWKR